MKTDALNTERSKQLWEKALKLIPCGTQTLSKAPSQFAEGVYPIYLDRGKGSHVWDVDGNEYIDFPLGLGAMILGYDYPSVKEAILKQLEKGSTFSLLNTAEIEFAELVNEVVPCAENVRFTKTGSEATSGAIRIARAYTGKKKIATCGYHGWHDWYVGATPRHLGVPEEVRNLVLTFSYNDPASLEKLFAEHPNQIAAVIMEPVGLVPPQNQFLEKVKEIAHKNQALLIFDEIVTGFRYALGGAQELYKVIPDLATMGKAVGNGMPLNLVCGKAEVMKTCENIFFSSTFGGETLSLVAGSAVIREMKSKNVISQLWKQGNKLLENFKSQTAKLQLKAELIGFGPRQFLNVFGEDGKPSQLLKAIFWQECIRRGVLFGNAQFISFSHSDADIEKTIQATNVALEYLKKAVDSGAPEKFYDGHIPGEIFRKQ